MWDSNNLLHMQMLDETLRERRRTLMAAREQQLMVGVLRRPSRSGRLARRVCAAMGPALIRWGMRLETLGGGPESVSEQPG